MCPSLNGSTFIVCSLAGLRMCVFLGFGCVSSEQINFSGCSLKVLFILSGSCMPVPEMAILGFVCLSTVLIISNVLCCFFSLRIFM